jgi:hypothetical protein
VVGALIAMMAGSAPLAPLTHADGGVGLHALYAFEAGNTGLVVNNNGSTWTPGLGMYAGTHPSISFTKSGPQAAFEANNSVLWTVGGLGGGNLGLGMMPGTSPSITIGTDGHYIIAFQGSDGNLWTTSNAVGAPLDWRLPMNPHSSPSITEEPQGGYEVAYEANTNELRLAGDAEEGTGLGMMPNTSPSIMTPGNGGYEIAFQANTSALWVAGTLGTGSTGLGMDTASSPAITTDPASGSGYEAAMEANTDRLWFTGTLGTVNTGLPMEAGTSPSITGMIVNGYEAAFHGADGTLWTYCSIGEGEGKPQITPTGQAMNDKSGPSITSFGTS